MRRSLATTKRADAETPRRKPAEDIEPCRETEGASDEDAAAADQQDAEPREEADTSDSPLEHVSSEDATGPSTIEAVVE